MSEQERSDNTPQPDIADLIRLAREAVIVFKLDGTVTLANRYCERLLGYSAGELRGQSVSQFWPKDSSPPLSMLLGQIANGNSYENFEIRAVRRDDTSFDFSLTLSPIRDERREVTGVLCLGLDMSLRARMQSAERDQLFLASIVSSAADAIISKDLDGIITSWNKGAQKMFGYTAGEMVGQPALRLIPAGHADEERQILARIRRGERIEHYESERLAKDGRIIQVSMTISPIKDRMGQIVGASNIAHDISERRQLQTAEAAQSFLGALVESAEDAIVSKDLNGVVTSWNPGAEKLFGYTASEMIGKPIALLIPDNHNDEEPQILSRIKRGERISHYETRRVHKDGSLIDVSLTVSPIKDSLGRIIGASKIARDISLQKKAAVRETELLKESLEARRAAEIARRHAEEANLAKDEFLAIVSHELRTPITAILGWTRMLSSGKIGPEQQKNAFEVLDRNSRAQAQLIEDLLDISRIISGKLRIEFKAVDIVGVISAAVDSLLPASAARGIAVEQELSKDAGTIIGDTQRLQQVVWNLLSNAIKFSPRNSVVRIQLQRADSQIELRVIDKGSGINPVFLPHVFHRFSQENPSITRRNAGLGVGLSIVKSIVELHGGTVSAFSEGEGQGATFTVKIPIYALHQADVSPKASIDSMAYSKVKSDELVGLKILIVDDEMDARNMLRYIFDQCGAIVETAQSVSAALEVFDRWNPNMLISDIGMPDIDGYELIRILRSERKSRIPAVALTAMTRIEDRLKAVSAGYQMHVPKPVEPAEIDCNCEQPCRAGGPLAKRPEGLNAGYLIRS
jgi:PAS domain S-box-containing protein